MNDTIQTRKKRWHFSVEKDFILNRDLHPLSRLLYMILQSFASPDSPKPFPGMTFLAKSLNCTEDTVRKYRQELEREGWLLVERRINEAHRYTSNAYVLLDGPEDNSMPKKTGMEKNGAGSKPCRMDTGAKSTQVKERAVARFGEEGREASDQGRSNTGPSAPASSAPAVSSASPPSAGAVAPEPPRVDNEGKEGEDWTDEDSAPELKAKRFIKGFKEWGEHAGLSIGVTQKDKQAVEDFYQENPKYRVRDMIAVMLCAWMQDPNAEDKETGRKFYWFCALKSRRVLTLMKHFSEIQDEIGWRGAEDQITKVLQIANKRFCIDKKKLAS